MAGVLASSAWDGRLCIWDLAQRSVEPLQGMPPLTRHAAVRAEPPPELKFEHLGNRDQVYVPPCLQQTFFWHVLLSPHSDIVGT